MKFNLLFCWRISSLKQHLFRELCVSCGLRLWECAWASKRFFVGQGSDEAIKIMSKQITNGPNKVREPYGHKQRTGQPLIGSQTQRVQLLTKPIISYSRRLRVVASWKLIFVTLFYFFPHTSLWFAHKNWFCESPCTVFVFPTWKSKVCVKSFLAILRFFSRTKNWLHTHFYSNFHGQSDSFTGTIGCFLT